MKFIANGTEYELVQARCTFAEARAIEKITGHSFRALMEDEDLQDTTAMQAMFWVSMKRLEPTLLFSDLDDMEIEAIEFVDEPDVESDEPDPTVAADEPVAATA